MTHTIRDKKKLINRVRRIRGQIDGIERLLLQENDEDCFVILQTIAACRGAMNGLMAEVMEEHIRDHVIAPGPVPSPAQIEAANELIEVVKTYLK